MAMPVVMLSMSSTVLPSQEYETPIAKQSALASMGRQVREALNKLPPEIVEKFFQDYKLPTEQDLSDLNNAWAERKRIESRAQNGQDIDLAWLQQSDQARHMDEVKLSADDSWNLSKSSLP